MSNRGIWILIIMVALASNATASPSASSVIVKQADRNAHNISSAGEFLAGLEEQMNFVHEGRYGSLESSALREIDEAQSTIAGLLEGRESARELKPDQRIALYNAQEMIIALVQGNGESRKVCSRVKSTGSRLAKTECLTVKESNLRASAGQQNVRLLQQPAGFEPGQSDFQRDGRLTTSENKQAYGKCSGVARGH